MIGFEDKILQSRHENNKKAVQAFEAKYQELVTKMNGDYDKNEKSSSSSSDGGEDGNKGKSSMLSQRPKPFPHVIHFIEDCQNEKINLLHDGDFHFGNDVPIWHFRAAMDALIAGARMADSPASFRMSHRKYSHQETVALEEFLVTEDIDIEHFGLEHVRTKQSAGCNFAVVCLATDLALGLFCFCWGVVSFSFLVQVWGFDCQEKYAATLVECLTGTKNLKSLSFRFLTSAEQKTKDWWETVASLVKHHKTLESVSFGFTRPRPLIAHNVMERHYEQHPEILETLLISIGSNRRLRHVALESVGLTTEGE